MHGSLPRVPLGLIISQARHSPLPQCFPRKDPVMRVPTITSALALGAALLLAAPTAAWAEVPSQLRTVEVTPVSEDPGMAPPAAVEPTLPDPLPTTEPAQPTPEDPAVPSEIPQPDPAPAPTTPVPAPTTAPSMPPEPLPSPSASPSPSMTTPTESPSAAPSSSPPAENRSLGTPEAPGIVENAGESAGLPAVIAPRTPVTPTRITTTAPRTASPTGSPSTSDAAASPTTDDTAAAPRFAATESAARYVAAGILSIIAVALALAIAVVAQPRRPRHTH